MKITFKLLSLVLALMMVFSLAACGGNGGSSDGGSADGGDAAAAETFDVGNFTVAVPSGWTALPTKDLFADDDNAVNPNAVNVVKGGSSDLDLLSHPYVMVNYYGPSTTGIAPSKDFYDNTADIAEQKIGNYTWTGFTGESIGYKLTILWAEDGDDQFMVTMYTETSNGNISLDDADVQAIIAGIAPKAAE